MISLYLKAYIDNLTISSISKTIFKNIDCNSFIKSSINSICFKKVSECFFS